MKKILLHSCCAPCANQPIDLLGDRGYLVEVYFGNSNIHYQNEFERRKESLRNYTDFLNLTFHEAPYLSGDWFQAIRNDGGVFAVIGDEHDDEMNKLRQIRCRLCYRYRMKLLAEEAVKLGINTIATTLAISPYQYQDILEEELRLASEQTGVQFLYEDWRPLYRTGQNRASELGFYRQRYCGCEFSRQEAEVERAARKAAREAARVASGEAGRQASGEAARVATGVATKEQTGEATTQTFGEAAV